jgi:hypothetical protein
MPPLPTRPQPAAHLVTTACPDLAPMVDASFGSTTRKLLDVVAQYYACRAAALAAAQ